MKATAVLGKVWITLISGFLSIIVTSCDNKEDLKPIDLRLMPGIWEVVVQGEQDVFVRGCYLDLKESTEPSTTDHHGYISTFYLTATDHILHDKVYSWSIRESDSGQPALDLVFQGELDSDVPWDGSCYYRIVKLTESHMWWKGNSVGDDSTIKLRRRTDINVE